MVGICGVHVSQKSTAIMVNLYFYIFSLQESILISACVIINDEYIITIKYILYLAFIALVQKIDAATSKPTITRCSKMMFIPIILKLIVVPIKCSDYSRRGI